MANRSLQGNFDVSHRFLLIGRTRRNEFQEGCQWLAQRFSCIQFDSISLVPDPLFNSPSDILLFQSLRGEFPAQQVNLLRMRFPLASFCCVLGSWIEGETRSGQPLTGVYRVSSQQFVSMMRTKTRTWNGWPTTTAADEHWMETSNHEPSLPNRQNRKVLVVGYDHSLVEALASACSELGFTATTGTPKPTETPKDVNCIIYDATRNRPQRIDDIRRFRELSPRTHLVVLIDFPRVEEREEMIRGGANEVLSKPFDLSQLLFEQK